MCGLFCKGDMMNSIYLNELVKQASPSSIHVSATPTASVVGSAATGAGNSQRVMNLVDQANDLYHTATTSPMGKRVIKAGKDYLAGSTVGLTAADIAGKYAPVAKQTAEHVFDNLVERVAPGMNFKSLDPAALGDKIIGAIDNATARKVIPPAPPVPKGMSLPAKLALGAATLGTTGLLGYGATRGYVNMNKEAFAKSLLEQGYSVEDTLALVKEASLLGKIKELPERYARGAVLTATAPLAIPAAHSMDMVRAARRAQGLGHEGEDIAKYTNAVTGDIKTFIGGTGALAAAGYAAKKLLDRAAANKASRMAAESIKQEAASGMSNGIRLF